MSGIAFNTVGASATMPASATNPTTGTSGTSSSSGTGSSSLTEQDFIQLLVAQLQDQNPTAPTNPQDLANEFSDMAMVSGITNLSQEASQIQSGSAPGQLAQAAALIGKTVAIPGSTLAPTSSGTAEGAFTLTAPASSATVSIFNSAGSLVGSIPVASPGTGLNTFTWSGGSSGSAYKFIVSAVNAAGASVPATTYAAAQVASVDLSQGTPAVSVTGSTTPVPLSNIAGLLGD